MRKSGLTTIEVIISVVILAALAALLLPALAGKRNQAPRQRTLCQSNMKQLAMACLMYSKEDPQLLFPPVKGGEPWRQPEASLPVNCGYYDDLPDNAMSVDAIYPEYLADLNILVCPATTEATLHNAPAALGQLPPAPCNYPGHFSNPDVNYVYLGYCIDDGDGACGEVALAEHGFNNAVGDASAQLVCVMEYIRDNADDHAALDRDIDPAALGYEPVGNGAVSGAPDATEGGLILRLREGLNVSPATIPIMWDAFVSGSGFMMFNHIPGGSNVLFMDGHVAFLQYPGPFPANNAFGQIMGSSNAVR